MTPKDKAIKLVNKYYNKIEHTISDEYAKVTKEITKQCALIAVDEILKTSPLNPSECVDLDDCGGNAQYWYPERNGVAELYWQEVKKEIEAL